MSTPVRAQYLRLKQPFPDALLLFRLGDFYELYGRDATIAARELELPLTAREFGGSECIPMCPLPYHAVETPIKRLVARGYKVAIAEQIGDPRTAKGLVAREIVRVVTPSSAIETHRRPAPDRASDESRVEPDGSDVPPSSREMATSVVSTSASAGGGASASASDTGGEGRGVAPTMQLALFDLSADGADTGW